METTDDPVHAALAARIGDDAATALLERTARYDNQPNTIRGMAESERAPEAEAAALAVVEDLDLLAPLGFGIDSPSPLSNRLELQRFWGLLTLAARTDLGVVDRVAWRFDGQDADDKLDSIRRAAAKHSPTPAADPASPAPVDLEKIVDASAPAVIRVIEQVLDLPWPDDGVDEPLEWEIDGLEGYTTWLTHVLPLAAGADRATTQRLVVPLVGLADKLRLARHRFDATAFTDDASTDPAAYDRRSAPAGERRRLGEGPT